ncbi:hypothetical protein Hbut_0028 [Hyperthermus butylicus DSM 5456]|uniref:Uncharacterized protein n=1 Tax=Hyperthermus butylicus (strain DSM 5456 / JCM 9403 / PLM1-5) TaxID=415426 RepID=A2BIV0_HYPBU|nr:hypothetical protein Hbut_0028 [Hyperthermus butylicus DSM 5456]
MPLNIVLTLTQPRVKGSLLKRWPKRREFLLYYLLVLYSKATGKKCMNRGEYVELLAPVAGSKNLASRIVKILVRQGFLERVKPLVYCVKPLDEVLGVTLVNYVAGRLRRKGINVNVEDRKLVVAGEECEKLKVLMNIGILECKDFAELLQGQR